METTLKIPDNLLREAKAAAARRGMHFEDFVAENLRRGVQEEIARDAEAERLEEHRRTRGERAREIHELVRKYIKPGESVVEGLLRERAQDDALDREDEERGL